MPNHNLDSYPQPKYKFGQKVKVKIRTKDADTGKEFINMLELYVRSIFADSNARAVEYTYGLTTDMPQPHYSGNGASKRVLESDIIVDDTPSPE